MPRGRFWEASIGQRKGRGTTSRCLLKSLSTLKRPLPRAADGTTAGKAREGLGHGHPSIHTAGRQGKGPRVCGTDIHSSGDGQVRRRCFIESLLPRNNHLAGPAGREVSVRPPAPSLPCVLSHAVVCPCAFAVVRPPLLGGVGTRDSAIADFPLPSGRVIAPKASALGTASNRPGGPIREASASQGR